MLVRTITAKGQRLLVPKVEIAAWWTSLRLPAKKVIELCYQHCTSEAKLGAPKNLVASPLAAYTLTAQGQYNQVSVQNAGGLAASPQRNHAANTIEFEGESS